MPAPRPEYDLHLTEDEANVVLQGLGELPAKVGFNLINKVAADLKNVVPSKLSKNDGDNLRESRRFLDQAQEKLKERNYNFALVLAEKAAELAATLPGR